MGGKAARYDIVIVGSGITGLSAAWHLHSSALKVAVLSDPARPPSSARGAGMVTAGLMDNFTRLVVAHGEDFARDFWQWSMAAFSALEVFASKRSVPWKKGRRQRLVVTPEERTEALEAVTRLKNAGFDVRYLDKPAELGTRVLGVQDEGLTGAWVDSVALLAALQRELTRVAWQSTPVTKIERQPSGLRIHTTSGVLAAEMVVLANHLDARALLPEMQDVLIPYADQWILVTCEHPFPATWNEAGHVFSAFHSYEWGVIRGERSLMMGGGRFLRPMAGIGAESAQVESKVSNYLLRQCEALWPGRGSCLVKDAGAFLESLPCDELPVVGPFFGDSRLLLAGGYGGSGLTMGFWAGKCLADFVQNGRCMDLPARLLPARLRSLS